MVVSTRSKGVELRTIDASRESRSHAAGEPVPSAPGFATARDADAHAELAVAQSTRLEANLGFLLRGIGELGRGASAARDACVALVRELESLRRLLDRSLAEENALRGRVGLLERALEAATRRAAEERSFVARQEEAFLAEVFDEHERELSALRERIGAGAPTLSTVPPPPDARTPIGAIALRTFRIPRPSLPGERRETPPPGLSTGPVVTGRPSEAAAHARGATTYSLGSDDVAEERVEVAWPGRDER
jgi:hypothetical protein